MTRADFLADSHIQGFSYWVAQRFNSDGNWRHSYVIRDSGARCTFTSLADAFRQYEWNGKSWSENFGELTTYRRQLRTAIATSNSHAAFAVCEAVLRWGGVWANNGRTLAARQPTLLDELRHVSAVLTSERTPTKSDMQLGLIACSMNAGFVKIYSVLLDSCVIYDGRVGAALGLFARQYCEIHGLPAVPPTLAFAYGPPKEAANAKRPKLRNPSRGTYRFPRLRRDVRFHTEHAMRANWFLQAALDCCPVVFSSGEAGFHELAAGLFMVGYDLTEN
jgi:hypothetical protein